MCGRYVAVSSPTILAERFAVEELRITEAEPSYNVAPRADVPVVAVSQGRRVLDVLRWGLVPSWAKDVSIGDRLINARAERITTSNAYKRAFERRRCIIPADGFYEWEKVERARKVPWFFRRRDGEPFALAGVWEIWHDPAEGDDSAATGGERSAESTHGRRDDSAATGGERSVESTHRRRDDSAATGGERSAESTHRRRDDSAATGGERSAESTHGRRDDSAATGGERSAESTHGRRDDAPRIRSCSIITGAANDLVAPIHDRMPVVLPQSVWDEWLDRENRDVASLKRLLVPSPAGEMEAWPVSTLVNKADNNGPELLEPVPVRSTI